MEIGQRGMDVEGYERGVAGLPDQLRAYANTMGALTMKLTKEQALLLADDLERGISASTPNARYEPEEGTPVLLQPREHLLARDDLP
ncbi:hypothetical protein LCGC14_0113070 [marine sediment metagenome]|uniref:Uncharacterized protein n=1 Tax=marine sediment metagenome TaxID=412755 RepID=A0A0F9XR69_9ZZZZ